MMGVHVPFVHFISDATKFFESKIVSICAVSFCSFHSDNKIGRFCHAMNFRMNYYIPVKGARIVSGGKVLNIFLIFRLCAGAISDSIKYRNPSIVR